MIFVQPWTINPVMPRGRAEIPYPGIAVSRQQAIPDQLVASPLADHRARYIADVVLIETQHRAQPRLRQRLACPRQPIAVQTTELDTLLEIHLRCARRQKGPVPPMPRLEIVFIDGNEFRFRRLFGHELLLVLSATTLIMKHKDTKVWRLPSGLCVFMFHDQRE